MYSTRKTPLALLTTALLLTACGGGSSSSGSDSSSSNSTVQGTVDGFGSVVVNGVHYKTTNASISVDDKAGVESDLYVGQVVTIVGSSDGSEGVAVSITYDVEVEGQVSSVNSLTGSFVVLGQTIITDSMTVFEGTASADISAGMSLEISGYRNADGEIYATFVKVDDSGEAELRGRIASLNEASTTFFIGSQEVNYANVTELDLDGATLSNDLLVEVEGSMNGDVLEADKIEAEDDHDFSEEDGDVEIYGYVSLVAEGSITVGGTQVVITSSTEFEHGSSTDLSLNTFVKVEGTVNADGELVASEISFEASVKLEVEGEVTAVGANSISVMGITAKVDNRTRVRDERDDITYFNLSNISSGDYVELKLSKEADGSLRALRLERDDADDEVKITAPIESVDLAAGTITMLGVTVDISAVLSGNLSVMVNGNYLEIKGTFNGSMIVATEVEEDDRYEDEHEDESSDD